MAVVVGRDQCCRNDCGEPAPATAVGAVGELLPWSDQRVITLELRVGEADLAIDMVRGAAHGPHPLPADIIARLHERLDGHDLPTCTDAAQLRRYLNRLRCA